MTTPDDVKPDDSVPAPASKKPAVKKPASAAVATSAKKVTPVAPTDLATAAGPAKIAVSAHKKVPAKTPAKAGVPAAASAQPDTFAPAKRVRTKPIAKLANPKPAVRKPKGAVMSAAPVADSEEPNTQSQILAAPASAAPPTTDWASTHATKILNRALKNGGKTDFVAQVKQKIAVYWCLTRMDRPIGTLLLLWPTLWSLWIAAKGVPSIKNLVIFVLGVIVMRAAGCVINDFADRKIDGRVERTKNRPLATGAVSAREALGLFITLCLIAFALVLFTDPFTIKLSVGGLILAFCYPFMKRHTHLPQVVLGAAFAWGIPMAYAAEAGELHQGMWLIYLAVVLWTVAYDTFYAMVDRDDDLKVGVKSTAILFGEQDRLMTGVLQIMTLYALMLVGSRFELGTFYYLGLATAAGLFVYQQWLIRFRAREACFKAFLNNNWVGVAVFAGIVMDYSFR